MTRPRFSIVIPTRNRAAYLGAAMRTVLSQSFSDFQLVITDNCSPADTRTVVEQLATDRVKYVRSNLPLTMTDNWELAVSHADGEFVCVLGDDDGLLPHALGALDTLLRKTGALACRFAEAVYHWPDCAQEANQLIVRAGQGYRSVDSKSALRRVARGEDLWLSLPILYHSMVHRSVIDHVRSKTGRLFRTSNPDVYSGIAFCHTLPHYLTSLSPLSIAGISRASNGHALAFESGVSNDHRNDCVALNSSAGLQFRAGLPDVPLLSIMVADCFSQCGDALGSRRLATMVSRRSLLRRCLLEMNRRHFSEDQYTEYLRSIEHSFSDVNGMRRLIRKANKNKITSDNPASIATPRPAQIVFSSTATLLDASRFGVKDVFDASILIDRLFDLERVLQVWHPPGPPLAKTIAKRWLPPAVQDWLIRRLYN